MEGPGRRDLLVERSGSSCRQAEFFLGVGIFGVLVMEVWFYYDASVVVFGRARGLGVSLETS